MQNLHPLLQRAQVYPRRDVELAPRGCRYDCHLGAWRVIDTGGLWIEIPERHRPFTKKQDIETGEDQKGE